MKPGHIFIVGLPRIGSKLVERILMLSPHIDYVSSGETHYIGHLFRTTLKDSITKMGDLSKEANVYKLIDYFYANAPFRAGGIWKDLKKGRFSRENFSQKLLASDRTEKGVYEVILRLRANMITNKTFLADKTNQHIYHVPTLIKWFPNAKIIHLLRDPRAILASELKRRMKIYPSGYYLPVKLGKPLYSFMIVLHMTIAWLYAVRLHQRHQKCYPQNYHMVKFEDLVSDPENTVKELCDFLDIEYDSRMLRPRQVHSSFASELVTGFDQKTLTRWQNHLKSWMKAWMFFWGKRYLRDFGYWKQ